MIHAKTTVLHWGVSMAKRSTSNDGRISKMRELSASVSKRNQKIHSAQSTKTAKTKKSS
jgi:phosphate-selective porin